MDSILKNRLHSYYRLIRLNQPVGIFLLLWPTLSALWIASRGRPQWHLLAIFILGTVLMRSAGCAINDFADRKYDNHVTRTANRPVAAGKIKGWEAVFIAILLAALAFLLVLPLNIATIVLSIIAVAVAASYPLFKRFFAVPQAFLGIAFGFGIPMAFTTVQNGIPLTAWFLWLANIFWAIAYDTEYALADIKDDLKIGIKTSAITFGRLNVKIIMVCYAFMLIITLIIGLREKLYKWFILGWIAAVFCAVYHFFLISSQDGERCFRAFRHNIWLGGFLFMGILLDYA